jgi:hypothetical protein
MSTEFSMSDAEITVSIDGDDDDAAASERRIADANKRGADARAEVARTRLETARLRTQAAFDHVDNSLLTAQSELSAAQSQHANALESGDFDGVAKATARIAAAESQRVLLQNQRQVLERTPISSGDQFEDHLSRFTGPTAEWMRAHKDWVTDPRKSSKLQGAHHLAIGEGLEPDTDEYFEHVEKTIGLRGGGGNGSGRGSRVAADINPRDVRTHIRDGGRSVYLTDGEKKTATDGTLVWNYGPSKGKPIGVQEMARRKIELNKQQMYTRL